LRLISGKMLFFYFALEFRRDKVKNNTFNLPQKRGFHVSGANIRQLSDC